MSDSAHGSFHVPVGDVAAAVGKVLGGRYRLVRVIGQGGMGAVYEAIDERSGGRVAAKLLHSFYSDDDDLHARLRREAQVAEHIRSPHIARVLNAGVNRERRGWIVFEYLDGESLDVRLKRDGQLSFADTSWIVEHTLLGLEAAHRVVVVHRDIKPGNLFIERTTPLRLRVVDFGVAKRFRRNDGATSGLTSFGTVLGTPSYASPEQLRGAKDIDVRADIYSVGLVAFRLIAGRLPFEHQELGALLAMKQSAVVGSLARATGITWPDALEVWIQRAAATRREDRFASAEETRTAWRGACEAMRGHAPGEVADGLRDAEDTDLAPLSR